jgi:uncharacterized protein YndB with AHSA1/START domain
MDEPVVEVETMIAAEPRTVWKAMTGKRSAMFPGTTVETDWRPGHPMTISGEWQGKPFTDHGEIETFEENEELSFTHWSGKEGETRPVSYHVVRYRLEPDGENTKVTLSQFNEGEDTEIDDKTRAEFRKNWLMMLEGLKKSAEAPKE